LDIPTLLPSIPQEFSIRLDKHYRKIKKNFLEGRYDPSELNGAKFCEVVLRILQWYTSPGHTFTRFGEKIKNFDQATREFENKSSFPDSIRFHIPKTLNVLYAVRNRRGVGHVGGDVDPNHMDALFVVSATDWILAELIRIFHNISTSEAQNVIEKIIARKMALVWEIEGRKRVLDPEMPYKNKVLILLYSEYPSPISDSLLFKWVEHSHISHFRVDILGSLHDDKLIEYDQETSKVYISPLGLKKVEEEIIRRPS
jgi:hypothetical protein